MIRIQPWTEPELMAREQIFEALTTKAIKQTVRHVLSELRGGALTAAVSLPPPPPETAPLVSLTALEGAVMATWTTAVDSELYPFLTATFLDSAEAVVDGLAAASGEVVDSLNNVFAEEFLSYAKNRMVNIGEQVWSDIRTQLSEGFAAGEGIKEIADRVKSVSGISTPRALTVARTEIISAANAGSYLQMLNAGFDEKVTKVWLATEDPRTRLSHRHADNQGVELTGEFSVDIYTGDIKTGSELLEFPGDPTGTPGNIINCRCSLAFDFDDDEDEDLDTMTAAFVEKEHPRDGDGKFKKKGAPNKYIKIPDLNDKPANSSPMVDKVAWMAAHKWDSMTAGQKGVLIKSIDEDTWKKLPPELKTKIKDAPSTTSHPEAKHLLEKDVAKLDAFPDEPDDAVDTDLRPLGGTDTKTGKALTPGKPVKLRVQLLYNTKFDNGAIMAVHKDNGERLVWDEGTKKILRQKLGANGKYSTTESKTRGDAYKAWKDEDGWTVPDAAQLATPAATGDADASPAAGAPAVGKPVALKVQLIYQTPFDDGDIVAVHPASGDYIKWDATKKRMVVHHGKGGTTEYTRGALYKEYKDADGWFLPADKKAAPTPAPAPAKKAMPKAAAPEPTASPAPAKAAAKSAKPKAAAPAATPDTTPAANVAPSGSQSVSAGGDASPFQTGVTEDLIEDLNDKWPNTFIDEDVFEDDKVKLTKVSKSYVEVYDKATGKSTEYKIDNLTPEHVSDFLELNAPEVTPAAPVATSAISKNSVTTIKDWANQADIPAGEELFNGSDFKVYKVAPDAVVIYAKTADGGIDPTNSQLVTGIHISEDGFNNVLGKMGLSGAATPAPAPAPAPAPDADQMAKNQVTWTKASWIKKNANDTKVAPGAILHDGKDYQIKKGGGDFIGIVANDKSAAKFLSNNEIDVDTLNAAIAEVIPNTAPPMVTPSVPVNMPAPQFPMKLSYNVLVNPKTTKKYAHGQVIAENPAESERLVWDDIKKKYIVQTQDANGDWVNFFNYSKQGAYKNLKDDNGWVTPSKKFADMTSSPTVPAVSGGGGLTSQAAAAKTIAAPQPKMTIGQLQTASDAKIDSISDVDTKKVFDEFKTGKSTMYLTSSESDLLDAVLRAQKKHNSANPGVQLNMLETIALVDKQSAKVAGVANGKLYEKKIVDWLGTPAGKKKASEIIAEFRMTPAEKAKLIADKQAAVKAELDKKLVKFHAIQTSKPHTGPFSFHTASTTQAQTMQDAMLKDQPWTASEKAALKKYTGSYYYTVNSALRGKSPATDDVIKDAINIQKGMRPLGEDLILYRGTGAIPGVLPDNVADYQSLIGTTFVEPAFSSTSLNNPFGGKVKLIIEAPKGTAAAYVKSISHFSSENEVLLGANTKFEILEAKQNGYSIEVRVRVVP